MSVRRLFIRVQTGVCFSVAEFFVTGIYGPKF